MDLPAAPAGKYVRHDHRSGTLRGLRALLLLAEELAEFRVGREGQRPGPAYLRGVQPDFLRLEVHASPLEAQPFIQPPAGQAEKSDRWPVPLRQFGEHRTELILPDEALPHVRPRQARHLRYIDQAPSI